MNNHSPKSAIAAGLLGIFLGSLGIHNFYLGDKKKGIIHLCLLGGTILLSLIGSIVVAAGAASVVVPSGNYLNVGGAVAGFGASAIFVALAGLVSAGNTIWGFVEGIIILVQGDAGLAAKGITVATAATAPAAEKTTEKKSESDKK